jgi:predicted RNA-binding Zn-ribbon protein involved in translation (DUF1610 family)
MSEFKSYWYVCQSCDASIEVVSKGIHFQDPTCNCNNSEVVWCQTSVVESDPKQTKEETMEYPYNNPEETTQVLALQELILKKDEQIVRLQNANSTYSTDANVQYGRINRVKDYLTENYDELEMHADEIANILQIELSREVTYTVTMVATVTVSVPVGEDGEDILNENLYIDANHGDIVIDSYDVDSISEDY